MNPFVRLYGYSVRAGVSVGMATGALAGIVIGLFAGGPVAAFLCGLIGVAIGGLLAVLPSALGSLVVVTVARRGSDVRRNLAITIALVIGVLDGLSLITDPSSWPGVLISNVVMAPMLWWAWRYLARRAEEVV